MNFRTKHIHSAAYRYNAWGTLHELMPWYLTRATIHINLYGAPTPLEEMSGKEIIRNSLSQGRAVYSRHVEFHLGQYKEVSHRSHKLNRTYKTLVVVEWEGYTFLITTALLPCPRSRTIPMIMMSITMATSDRAIENFTHYATSL